MPTSGIDEDRRSKRLIYWAVRIRRLGLPYQYLLTVLLFALAEVLSVVQDTVLISSPLGAPFLLAILLVAFLTSRDGPLFFAGVLGYGLTVMNTFESSRNTLIASSTWQALIFAAMVALVREVIRAERRARRQAMGRAQEAITATQTKDRFLAAVSHDLRQPLAGIKMYVSLMRRSCKEVRVTDESSSLRFKEETERAIDAVENCMRQQERLVNDLLDTARINEGKVQLHTRSMSLDNVLGYACDLVQPAAGTKAIVFVPPAQTGIRITADRDRIQQCLWNVISNAVKFTDVGGRVEVSVEAYEKVVRVLVRDTGRGLTPEEIRHVFDPWWQRNDETTRDGGLGLGLMITRRLIEMHGGQVTAASPGLGKGSIFTITLPLTRSTRISLDQAVA